MPPKKNQPPPTMRLTCPRCGREHALGRGELAPGRGWRCACGWSLLVVRRLGAAPRASQALPAG